MSSASLSQSRSRQFAVTLVLAFLLWLLLVGRLDREELIAGLLVSLAAAVLTIDRIQLFAGLRLSAQAPLSFLRYLGVFFVALIRANLDMARRVLSPSLPIRPALVRVHTGLQSDLGRLALANSITLTPGTLTVDFEGDELLVHWIDCPPGADMQAVTAEIAGRFEEHLKGFLL